MSACACGCIYPYPVSLNTCLPTSQTSEGNLAIFPSDGSTCPTGQCDIRAGQNSHWLFLILGRAATDTNTGDKNTWEHGLLSCKHAFSDAKPSITHFASLFIREVVVTIGVKIKMYFGFKGSVHAKKKVILKNSLWIWAVFIGTFYWRNGPDESCVRCGSSRVTWALFRKEMSLLNFSNLIFHCAEHHKHNSTHIHYIGVEAEISRICVPLHGTSVDTIFTQLYFLYILFINMKG